MACNAIYQKQEDMMKLPKKWSKFFSLERWLYGAGLQQPFGFYGEKYENHFI